MTRREESREGRKTGLAAVAAVARTAQLLYSLGRAMLPAPFSRRQQYHLLEKKKKGRADEPQHHLSDESVDQVTQN